MAKKLRRTLNEALKESPTTSGDRNEQTSLAPGSEELKRRTMAAAGLDLQEQEQVLNHKKGNYSRREFGRDRDDVDYQNQLKSNAQLVQRMQAGEDAEWQGKLTTAQRQEAYEAWGQNELQALAKEMRAAAASTENTVDDAAAEKEIRTMKRELASSGHFTKRCARVYQPDELPFELKEKEASAFEPEY